MPWLHNDLTELANSAGSPATGSAIAGHVTQWNQQQHIFYVGRGGRIYELYYSDNQWQANDLLRLVATGGRLALTNAITSCATDWDERQHVFYIDDHRHVSDLYYDGSQWRWDDLANVTPVEDTGFPADEDTITCCTSEWNNEVHVNFLNGGVHVREFFTNEQGRWLPNDLTKLSSLDVHGGAGGGLSGYATPWNSQLHVMAKSKSLGVSYELVFKDDHWFWNDLSTTGSGIAVQGYTTPWNQQEHIVYIDAQGHVNELYYPNPSGSWAKNDLTTLSGSDAPASKDTIDGYATVWNSQQHVNFIDGVGHVRELYYRDGAGWRPNDLTELAEATSYPAIGSLHAFATSWNSQQHVHYLDDQGHIHELYYSDDATVGGPVVRDHRTDGSSSGGGFGGVVRDHRDDKS